MIRRTVAAAALLCTPLRAEAHAFQAGQEGYDLFVQGVAQPWLALPTALVLVGTGLLLAIWREEGMLAGWPVLAVCAAIGFGLGPLVPPVGVVALAAFALAVGGLGILAPRLPGPGVLAMAGGAMLLSARYLMEDHPMGDLPLPFLLGMAGGALAAVGLPAGVVQASRTLTEAPWVLIFWRALASWVAAVAVLMVAFTLRGAT
ncbi:hypothetical protein [Tropicimonas sp. S265A]|uniref:hypothetical protein n=1 Tax=Tropicimonas sp. S265A TaxID=3415134 RepID=UPI003C7E9131